MKIKLAQITTLLTLFILIFAGCGPSDIQIATMTAAAWTSTPEATFTPSATSTPTISPTPTFTSTPEATPTPTYEVGDSWTRPKDGMLVMYISAGSFTIGVDPDDAFAECLKTRDYCGREWFTYTPVDTASTDAFWIDSTEVTNQMYAGCVSEGVCTPPRNTGLFDIESYGNYPVGYVNLADA